MYPRRFFSISEDRSEKSLLISLLLVAISNVEEIVFSVVSLHFVENLMKLIEKENERKSRKFEESHNNWTAFNLCM